MGEPKYDSMNLTVATPQKTPGNCFFQLAASGDGITVRLVIRLAVQLTVRVCGTGVCACAHVDARVQATLLHTLHAELRGSLYNTTAQTP